MKYLSLFSGVEAATVAWEPLGWEPVGFCEFDNFPSAVLRQHYPEVPNFGDVTKITESAIKKMGKIDLVVFGSPCQDLSVAGSRKGLEGEKSGLFTTAIKVIRWAIKHGGCRFALWENVPGAFSSNGGADFAEILRALTGDRFAAQKWQTSGVAISKKCLLEWSVLDAQYFGVPQRRRRVFALADFGDWTGRSTILFEPKSLHGDTETSKKEGEDAPSRVAKSNRGDDRTEHYTPVVGPLIARDEKGIGNCYVEGGKVVIIPEEKRQADTEAFNVTFCDANGTRKDRKDGGLYVSKTDQANTLTSSDRNKTLLVPPVWPKETACTLNAAYGEKMGLENQHALGGASLFVKAVTVIDRAAFNQGPNALYDPHIKETHTCPTMVARGPHAVHHQGVRRLTPIECERLQGFPDNYTRVPYRNKDAEQCPNGPRYKALGNSMAVPVMRWIGQRIQTEIYESKGSAGDPQSGQVKGPL